jgi:hypothetical protein
MKTVRCVLATFAFVLPLSNLTGNLAHAEDGVVLDYRNRQFRDAQPANTAADKTRLAAALASIPGDAVKALGKDFVVLGQAKGKLAKGGDVEFFLLSLARPVAAEPFPKTAAQVIVALKGKDSAGTYVLPAARQYMRLVGAVDTDGDGSSEVLLEGSGYNMGQLIVSVDAVKLDANGTTRVAQSVAEAYSDTCGNPIGEKSRSAKTIALRGGKLVATAHPEKCG